MRKGACAEDSIITYEERLVAVSPKVAELLESDDRRLRAQARSDRRRLSRENVETVSGAVYDRRFALENKALQDLRSEALRNALATLDADSQRLLYLYY